jgi:ribose/xylose/arabinose/galactoside ABC-type transport system permease subunit
MTLAMATILQGLLILIAGGSAISVTNPALDWLGSAHVLTISVSIILWADRIYAARQGRVETFYEVAARGKVQ